MLNVVIKMASLSIKMKNYLDLILLKSKMCWKYSISGIKFLDMINSILLERKKKIFSCSHHDNVILFC